MTPGEILQSDTHRDKILTHGHTCLKMFKSQPCLWHFMTFIIHEGGSSVSVCDRVTNAIYISYCCFSKLNMMVSISGCEQRKCMAVCVLVHVGQTTYTMQMYGILLFALCTMLWKHKASLLRNYSYQACKKYTMSCDRSFLQGTINTICRILRIIPFKGFNS